MSRPRGFTEGWTPKPETELVLAQVQEILREYREHLPMTARQIFYRLVGAYGYDKTERAYKRLCENLVKARRAQMIPFWKIRDDGTKEAGGDWGYDSPEAFIEELLESGSAYRRLTREGQDNRVELWCEAAGMIPMLDRVARPFGVPVYSTGGFSSVTVTHEIADRAVQDGRPTVFLHVGDYDPSGESIFHSMTEDALAFAVGYGMDWDDFKAIRVALTEDQVHEHDLPTAPPKASDSRSRNWIGETCQAEAMPPDLLSATVTAALEDHTDLDLLEETRERSREERAVIVEKLAGIKAEFDE